MRGTAAGEAVVSQAQTREFDEGYSRTFAPPDGSAKGGRWIWDARQGRLVRAEEYEREALALNAPVLTDRLHEGQRAPDGTDIGTRQRRRAWMKEADVVDYADGETLRRKRTAEQEAKARGEFKRDPELRDIIGRELYKRKMIY